MKQHPLTPQQAQAAAMLATGQTQEATAQAVGVCRVTIARWLKLDTFQEAIAQTIAQTTEAVANVAVKKTLSRLEMLTELHLKTYESLMSGELKFKSAAGAFCLWT
jgi:hypothetical protein